MCGFILKSGDTTKLGTSQAKGERAGAYPCGIGREEKLCTQISFQFYHCQSEQKEQKGVESKIFYSNIWII